MQSIQTIISEQINQFIKEDCKSKLFDNAWDIANFEVDDIPVKSAVSYLPSDEKTNYKQKQNRELIWCFKNDSDDYSDEEYLRAKQRVFNYVKRVLTDCFGSDVKKLCLVCVPCHSAEVTERRWKELSNDLCDDMGMTNGFDHIKYKNDADHPSHWGGHTYPSVSFDKQFFAGRNVVLLDDLITSGQTIRKTRDNLENVGANTVLAITLAKTEHHNG